MNKIKTVKREEKHVRFYSTSEDFYVFGLILPSIVMGAVMNFNNFVAGFMSFGLLILVCYAISEIVGNTETRLYEMKCDE